MLAVALIAVNLAAFLFVAGPHHEDLYLVYLTLGTVPMLDALAITGWRLAAGRRPFLVGFLYWGAAAVVTHVYCYLATEGLVPGWCEKTAMEFYGFCVVHDIPGRFARPGSPAFFCFFFPALALLISGPQFAVALCGGVLEAAIARAFRRMEQPPPGTDTDDDAARRAGGRRLPRLPRPAQVGRRDASGVGRGGDAAGAARVVAPESLARLSRRRPAWTRPWRFGWGLGEIGARGKAPLASNGP
jgi:hypothetical protein